ncbi:MAG: flagellar biosynthesis protein FlhF [Turicibacter sp.]|nr:flagellar biosynthesis protein FlhF [Turicibacter sp.]
MKTKKFEGKTEQEALEKVKNELGLSAIVLNIRKKQAKGFKGLFKKPTIVVTAAFDETESNKDKILEVAKQAAAESKTSPKPTLDVDIDEKYAALENQQNQQNQRSDFPDFLNIIKQDDEKERTIKLQNQTIAELENLVEKLKQDPSTQKPHLYENTSIRMFYDSLINQGVLPEIAKQVLENANALSDREKQDINLLVKIVYNKIIEILGEPRVLVGQETGAGYQGVKQVVIFMGPTGVGKTTTIAKLSSLLLINFHKQVGLITADTYRIAAVEQLRTYADIMGLNLNVIYSGDEIIANVDRLQETHDVILVDTAGRSHNNHENLMELKNMLEFVPSSNKFLVLSVNTREDDILNIIRTYDKITDFDLIFTKLDEAECLGTLLNICHITGKKISYVSFGQNVPEDIEKIQPDKIAKSLLGTGFDSAEWGDS